MANIDNFYKFIWKTPERMAAAYTMEQLDGFINDFQRSIKNAHLVKKFIRSRIVETNRYIKEGKYTDLYNEVRLNKLYEYLAFWKKVVEQDLVLIKFVRSVKHHKKN